MKVDNPVATGSIPVDPRGHSVHVLSLKIAAFSTIIVGFFALGLYLASDEFAVWTLYAVCIVVFTAVYFTGRRVLSVRLEKIRTDLEQLRSHQLESSVGPTSPIIADELDGLIRDSYNAARDIEDEFDELKKVENYRRVFVGNVSHELKTPIFSILGYAETLLGGAIDDETVNRSFVEKIDRNAKRLNNLARDLGEISKLETGELQMHFEPFDLPLLLTDVVESLEPIATARLIDLCVSVDFNMPAVTGDAQRVRQVLVNLTENALKYTNENGQVEIVARATTNGKVKITVADNGIGISEEHVPRLTERFFRIDASRSRSAGGTGLGLAIVKHILAAHDETLQIESRPDRGSTFGFHLPVFEGVALEDQDSI